jgi:hypothetical protein
MDDMTWRSDAAQLRRGLLLGFLSPEEYVAAVARHTAAPRAAAPSTNTKELLEDHPMNKAMSKLAQLNQEMGIVVTTMPQQRYNS